jgi:protein-tyrosine kinase
VNSSIVDRIFRRGQRAAGNEPDIAGERQATLRHIATLCEQQLGTSNLLIGVTGPAGGEGSTLICAGLAATFATQSGRRVVFVDTRMPGSTDGSGDHGLTNWLESGGELAAYLRPEPNGRYQCLPPGTLPAPIGPSAWVRLPAALRQIADVAVCDLTAPLASPEGLHLAKVLDGVVLVLEAEETRWQVAQSAQRLLENAQVRIIGTVLNKRRHFIPDKIYRLL